MKKRCLQGTGRCNQSPYLDFDLISFRVMQQVVQYFLPHYVKNYTHDFHLPDMLAYVVLWQSLHGGTLLAVW
jgi:hypothetical protein